MQRTCNDLVKILSISKFNKEYYEFSFSFDVFSMELFSFYENKILLIKLLSFQMTFYVESTIILWNTS